MADCYRIPYSDRFGAHVAFKWADAPREAVSLLKSRNPNAEIGEPVLVRPAPFSEESREARAKFWGPAEPASSEPVAAVIAEVDDDVGGLAVEGLGGPDEGTNLAS